MVVVAELGDEHGHELAGVVVTEQLPRGEWFVTLADRPESVRLDAEVPVVSALHTLRPTGDTEVAATTSVRYEHRPTVTVRRIGAGRVVALGATDVDAALRHGTLGTFVRRLLRTDTAVGRSSRTLGVAVVGYGPYGGMGYTHGLACAETDGLALVAAVDTSAERLKAAQVDFPDLVGYDSVGAAVADPDVDVAIVATPPVMHASLALELLRAGKHVVIEKPMCLSTAEADELMAVATTNDRTLTVHQSRRWDRDFLTLRRAHPKAPGWNPPQPLFNGANAKRHPGAEGIYAPMLSPPRRPACLPEAGVRHVSLANRDDDLTTGGLHKT